MSTTSTGKTLNLTIEDLGGMLIELRPLGVGGEPWDISGKTFYGELYDELTDEKVGDIECSVTGEGRVLSKFPEMGRGRYSFAVYASDSGGDTAVFVDGYVGYSAPAVTGGGFVDSVNRVVNVIVDGARRIAVWAHTSAAERAAERAEAALETVEDKIGELDRVMPAVEALESGIENAVTINEAGNWQVGNIDKGVRAQGPAGANGITFVYRKLAREEDLPHTGSPLRRYILATDGKARLQIKIEQVSEKPHQYIGISVNGVEAKVYADAGSGYPDDLTGLIVNAINSNSSLPITAERKDGYIPYQIVELSAKTSGAAGNAITIEKIVPFVEGFGRLDYALVLGSDEEVQEATLSGGGTAGQYQYVWGDSSWIRLPLSGNEIATEESHGLVKLGTVGGWGNRLPVLSGGDGGLYVSIPSLPALERLAALEARMDAAEAAATALAGRVAALEGAGYVSSESVEHVEVVDELPDAPDAGTLYIQTAE